MKKIPAQVSSAFAIIIINLTSFLLFVYFLHGHIFYNGFGGFITNSTWFGADIDFITFLNRYYYGNLGIATVLNLFWVCVVPYAVADKNRPSMRRWYWTGLVINILIGIMGAPLLVWLPYGLDMLSFLILLGLSLLVSLGAYIISSLLVDKSIKMWWRP